MGVLSPDTGLPRTSNGRKTGAPDGGDISPDETERAPWSQSERGEPPGQSVLVAEESRTFNQATVRGLYRNRPGRNRGEGQGQTFNGGKRQGEGIMSDVGMLGRGSGFRRGGEHGKGGGRHLEKIKKLRVAGYVPVP